MSRVTRADIEALIATGLAMAERDEPGAAAGAGAGAPARGARADGDVGAVGVAAGPRDVGVPRRVACKERLAICAESGVNADRAMALAVEDARACAAGRGCICEEGKR